MASLTDGCGDSMWQEPTDVRLAHFPKKRPERSGIGSFGQNSNLWQRRRHKFNLFWCFFFFFLSLFFFRDTGRFVGHFLPAGAWCPDSRLHLGPVTGSGTAPSHPPPFLINLWRCQTGLTHAECRSLHGPSPHPPKPLQLIYAAVVVATPTTQASSPSSPSSSSSLPTLSSLKTQKTKACVYSLLNFCRLTFPSCRLVGRRPNQVEEFKAKEESASREKIL